MPAVLSRNAGSGRLIQMQAMAAAAATVKARARTREGLRVTVRVWLKPG